MLRFAFESFLKSLLFDAQSKDKKQPPHGDGLQSAVPPRLAASAPTHLPVTASFRPPLIALNGSGRRLRGEFRRTARRACTIPGSLESGWLPTTPRLSLCHDPSPVRPGHTTTKASPTKAPNYAHAVSPVSMTCTYSLPGPPPASGKTLRPPQPPRRTSFSAICSSSDRALGMAASTW